MPPFVRARNRDRRPSAGRRVAAALAASVVLAITPGLRAQGDGDESARRSEREEDSVALTFGVAYYQAFGGAYGATAGLYLSENTLLEVDAYRAGSIVPGQKSESVALRLQHFYARTLYVRGGVRLRHIETFDSLDFRDHEERIVQDDLGADLALGARHQSGVFVIGADLLGIYVPIDALDTKRQFVDDRNEELLDEEVLEGIRRLDVRVLAAYVGVSF